MLQVISRLDRVLSSIGTYRTDRVNDDPEILGKVDFGLQKIAENSQALASTIRDNPDARSVYLSLQLMASNLDDPIRAIRRKINALDDFRRY